MCRRVSMGRWPLCVAGFASLLTILMVAGCGGNPLGKSSFRGAATDPQRIRRTIDSLHSGRGAWKTAFVEAALPSGAAEEAFLKYQFSPPPEDEVKIDGDSATAKVRVTDADGNVVGEVEWTLKQEAGLWKISAAPLP
jgi:hypothetical protein